MIVVSVQERRDSFFRRIAEIDRLLTDDEPKDNLATDYVASRDGVLKKTKLHFARGLDLDGKPMLENLDQVYFYERKEQVNASTAEG